MSYKESSYLRCVIPVLFAVKLEINKFRGITPIISSKPWNIAYSNIPPVIRQEKFGNPTLCPIKTPSISKSRLNITPFDNKKSRAIGTLFVCGHELDLIAVSRSVGNKGLYTKVNPSLKKIIEA